MSRLSWEVNKEGPVQCLAWGGRWFSTLLAPVPPPLLLTRESEVCPESGGVPQSGHRSAVGSEGRAETFGRCAGWGLRGSDRRVVAGASLQSKGGQAWVVSFSRSSDTPLLLTPDLGPAAHVLLHHRPLLPGRTSLLWGMASFH